MFSLSWRRTLFFFLHIFEMNNLLIHIFTIHNEATAPLPSKNPQI